MKNAFWTITILALSAAVAWGCGGKQHHDDDADGAGDGDADGSDLTETTDTVEDGDAGDVPADDAGDAIEEDAPPTPPEWVLKHLGRYDRQAEATDDLLGTAVMGTEALLVASGSGLAIVDRAAIEAGTVTAPLERFLVGAAEPSNLDGVSGAPYLPRFLGVDASGTHAYVSTRFDGLWILEVTGSGTTWTVSEAGRLMVPRGFSESAQVVGTRLYVAHHADGIEVMDLADPAAPVAIDAVTAPLVDVWGMDAKADGKVWVADGVGGVKLLRLVGSELSYVTGDTPTSAQGTVFDVAAIGNWVVAAAGGSGVAVYEEWTAAWRETYPLGGVCTDIAPMDGDRAAVACGGWVHVVEVNSMGILHVLATTRLHRRDPGATGTPGSRLASGVSASGDVIYVAGIDSVDAYGLLEDDSDDDADIQASGQAARFGAAPGAAVFTLENAGQGTLEISSVDCGEPSVTCEVGSTSVLPGGATTLTITFDGSATDVEAVAIVHSNDPDDGSLPFTVTAALADGLDPQEAAPDFTGASVERDYETSAFVDGTIHLDDYAVADQVVHFAIASVWCSPCLEAVAAMGTDIEGDMPTGSVFFVIDAGDPADTVRHVLEKIRIPVTVLLDTDGVVADAYGQPAGDFPVFSSYVLDADGYVADVFTTYDPAAALLAVGGAI